MHRELQWGLTLSSEETSDASSAIRMCFDARELQWGLTLSSEETGVWPYAGRL